MASTTLNRDPLSDGVSLNDAQNQIIRWNLDGVEWSRNTDAEGVIYVALEHLAAGGYRVELYRDPNRTKLVASGQRSDPVGALSLKPANSSGLSGQVWIYYSSDDPDIRLPAFPRLLAWRLARLRDQWKDQDWPEGSLSDARPLVDPDLIDLSHLRTDVNGNPAYALWTSRAATLQAIRQELHAVRELAATAQAGIDGLFTKLNERITADRGTAPSNDAKLSATALTALEQEETTGKSIEAKLKTKHLARGELKHFLRILTLASGGEQILDTEWEDVYDILIQVYKRWLFPVWREGKDAQDQDSEKAKGITLSPDFFQIPKSVTLPIPVPPAKTGSTWRAAFQDRLDWEDRLESRIDQEKGVGTAFWDAVSKTEEEVLADLRDALIFAAVDEGADLTAKATLVARNLLIDTRADSCQQTTRISQAIETLQNLLWSLRTGQLRQFHPALAVTEEFRRYFDEEWKWLGAYASWRGAIFAFLYPENILLPSLRDRQTPAFRQLLKSVQANRRLTPEQACLEAKKYSDYFRDICNLTPEASCHALTRIYEGSCRDRREVPPRTLFYVFATGRHTNTLYWSAYDPAAVDQDFAQSYWEAVPKLENVTKIVGAHPYKIADKERYVYLFAQVREEGEEKLVFVRYSLETQGWDEDVYDLELPKDSIRFDVVLCQRQDDHKPPRLLVRNQNTGNSYTRMLSADGLDWEEQEDRVFQNWVHSEKCFDPILCDDVGRILAAHQISKTMILLIANYKPGPLYPAAARIIADTYEYRKIHTYINKEEVEEWVWQKRGPEVWWQTEIGMQQKEQIKTWVGSIAYMSDQIYAFWRSGPYAYYEGIHVDSNGDINSFVYDKCWTLPAMEHIGAPSGPAPEKGDTYFAYNLINDMGVFRLPLKLEENHVVGVGSTRITPYVTGPFDIVEQLTTDELQKRRKLIQAAWWWNDDKPQSNLTYIEEAYYFVPVQFALQLQKQGHYIEALDWFRTVYDYTIPEESPDEKREIYYGLVREKDKHKGYQRATDWLRDPLNPHRIAAVRRNTYTRFTVLSIVRCLLDYADAEFTRDTSESLGRARELYMRALALLNTEALQQNLGACTDRTHRLLIDIVREYQVPDEYQQSLSSLGDALYRLESPQRFEEIELDLRSRLEANDSWETFFGEAQALTAGKEVKPAPSDMTLVLQQGHQSVSAGQQILLRREEPYKSSKEIGRIVGTEFKQAGNGDYSPYPQERIVDPTSATRAVKLLYSFCISPNPILHALKLHAELNLYKLRTCRNIAGMKRTLEPYAAPTDQVSGLPQIGASGRLVLPQATAIRPSPYRFSFLIDRAKQLIAIAQQMESAMLAALERYDAEAYNRLKAEQDIDLAKAHIQLQDLRVEEARDGVKLAKLQKDRAQIQVDQYREWLDDGLSKMEQASLGLMIAAAAIYTAAAVAAGFKLFDVARSEAFGFTAQALQTTASMLAQWASYERREQEWEFQKTLAEQDVRIGAKQVEISKDHVLVVGQERNIARLQSDHAKDTLEFLANKFTSAELYEWMSGILEGVYRYFLEEATAVAKLAENQLAFERQSPLAGYVQNDYWEAPTAAPASALSVSAEAPERHGLTGSARLLQDVYRLDQYALETDKRKLQLTKTISLVAMSPVEFRRFQETGVMTFRTGKELFDRDFPGHYLLLIKSVRTSVIALCPVSTTLAGQRQLSCPVSCRCSLGGFSPSKISETPCHHCARRQFRISRGWLHADL